MEDIFVTMKGREIILGILQDEPHTGYEIKEVLQTRLSHFYDGTFGMIYPTLKKLEKEKLVTKEQITQSDKPNKNVYSITEIGKKEFAKAVLEPTSDEILKSDFLLRLYFSDYLSQQQIKQFIEVEIIHKQKKLDELKTQLDAWIAKGMTHGQKITFDYGVAYYSSTIDVLQNALLDYQ